MAFHSGQDEQVQKICNTEEGILLFTPRLYTSDTYSAVLTVENVQSLPSYHTSTFVFSSHISAAEHESDKVNEWAVDLYPKGKILKTNMVFLTNLSAQIMILLLQVYGLKNVF